jgi:outer membrane immunogenic protein
MRQKLLGTVAVIAIVTALGGPVAAADMAAKGPPPAPVPYVTNWSGFYVGGEIGGAWAKFRGMSDPNEPEQSFGDFSTTGFALGLHAGYNWQFGNAPWGSWLFGLEGDVTLTPGLKKKLCASLFCNTEGHTQGQLDGLASIRGRLGLVFDRTLVYATGGVAWARRSLETGSSGFVVNDGVITGAVVGGGIEWKYSPNVSLRLEAREYLFNETKSGPGDTCCNDIESQGLKNVTTVMAGVNWHLQ